MAASDNGEFRRLADEAQLRYGAGHPDPVAWLAAEQAAPGILEEAQAARGRAASLYRGGEVDEAIVLARGVLTMNEAVLKGAPDHIKPIRELAQTQSVLGRMIVREAALGEQKDWRPMNAAATAATALEGLQLLVDAKNRLHIVESAIGRWDQYGNNIFPHLAIATALYGRRYAAPEYVAEALKRAPRSESPAMHGAANLSSGLWVLAAGRGVARAFAADAVAHVVRPTPGKHRRAPLKIATNRHFGL